MGPSLGTRPEDTLAWASPELQEGTMHAGGQQPGGHAGLTSSLGTTRKSCPR